MCHRGTLLLAVVGLIGAGCLLGGMLANLCGWPQTGHNLAMLGAVAIWSYVVGMIVQRTTRAEARPPAIPKSWLPEVVSVEIAQDLVPELNRCHQAFLDLCAALRTHHAVGAPVIRIRDDGLLASRSYAISINGIRMCGATLGPSEDLQTKLGAALETVWEHHAQAIRFFADLHAQAA